ncbi:MAG: hypothetical protein ABI824_09535 [Acidobacteriota bacterium]
MALTIVGQIRQALRNLNPADVRKQADRPIHVGLVAPSAHALGSMETFLVPPHLSPERRAESARVLVRGGDSKQCDIQLVESSLLVPRGAFPFDLDAPEETVRRVIKAHEDLRLPLARHLEPFRKPVSHQIIGEIAKENAMFCLATALPDIIPSLISLPWAVGEYSSDAAFLTVNQVRMAFLLAAANDHPIGYRDQKTQIASIAGSSFGWRALARELVGKIPLGGGLIPKAAIAWAGTYAVGLSLERLYRLGYGFTREERRGVYEDAFKHGKEIAGALLADLRGRKTA